MVMEELAKRAVGCKGWRWMPGMLAISPHFGLRRVLQLSNNGGARWDGGLGVARGLGFPDLTDPATMGCLEALVREVYQRDGIGVSRDGGSWTIIAESGVWCGYGHEEYVEALVCALEAAP